MTYKDWLKRYHGELLARTGLNPEDGASDDCLKSFYKEKASPGEIVDWLIEEGGKGKLNRPHFKGRKVNYGWSDFSGKSTPTPI